MSSSLNLFSLDKYILGEIFSFSSTRDLDAIRQTCRALYEIVEEEQFVETVCKRLKIPHGRITEYYDGTTFIISTSAGSSSSTSSSSATSDQAAAKRCEYTKRKGKRHGPDIGWFETGNKLYERHWVDGVLSGTSTLWYDDGIQPRLEWTWRNGKKHGADRGWYSDGKLAFEKHWCNGVQTGDAKAYYPSGNLRMLEEWKDGKKHGKTIWYRDGDDNNGGQQQYMMKIWEFGVEKSSHRH